MAPRRVVSLSMLSVFALAALLSRAAHAWDQQPDGYEVIDGPGPTQSVDDWRRDWAAWRKMELQSVRYDARDACNVYNVPATQWTQRSFVQAFLMLHDRDIFDRAANAYTVDKYVTAMEGRVGKLDSVLLWPAYPNSGIDNRNQWDFLRSLPGGLDGLRTLIAAFHARDIRVILPYNPWDTATRDETGREDVVRMYSADIETLETLVPALGADGFNGDTMYGVPSAFYNCSSPLVATPEGGVPSAFLSHNPMSWGYYYGYAHFPPVARAKLLEPRHMVQVCARWSLDRIADVQTAFFNGVGYVVWENVWGIWNAMTPRESEAARRAFHVLRAFRGFTGSPLWRPYAARSEGPGQVSATAFPHPEHPNVVLYTVINAGAQAATLRLPLSMDGQNASTNATVYDVFRGLETAATAGNASSSVVEIALDARGFGAVLVVPSAASLEPSAVVPGFAQYMEQRRTMVGTPLESFSNKRELLRQEMTRTSDSDVPSTERTLLAAATVGFRHRRRDAETAADTEDDDKDDTMVLVKGARAWWFNVTGVQIEPVAAWTPNAAQYGTGVQFPWEDRPWNNHSVRLDVRDFYVDRHPVTNAQFRAFLDRAAYAPRTLDRFLEHWENRMDAQTHEWKPLSQWRVPLGLERAPVVFVAVEDARAYASFYSKRLPHDWEWQFVASNGDAYSRFPWGGDELDAARLPRVSRDKTPRPPDAVGSFPASQAAASGVQDLVGLVWQMTDQFCDAHTCGLVLRGGSFYRPVAATLADPNWYFPQAYEATQHNRLLQLSESADRSAFVGFRCAKSVVGR